MVRPVPTVRAVRLGHSGGRRCSAQQSRGTNADTAASWHTSHTVAHTRTRRLAPAHAADLYRPPELEAVARGVTIGAVSRSVLTSGVRTLFSLGFLACTLGVPSRREADNPRRSRTLELALAMTTATRRARGHRPRR